jgi:hypothetical protein
MACAWWIIMNNEENNAFNLLIVRRRLKDMSDPMDIPENQFLFLGYIHSESM